MICDEYRFDSLFNKTLTITTHFHVTTKQSISYIINILQARLGISRCGLQQKKKQKRKNSFHFENYMFNITNSTGTLLAHNFTNLNHLNLHFNFFLTYYNFRKISYSRVSSSAAWRSQQRTQELFLVLAFSSAQICKSCVSRVCINACPKVKMMKRSRFATKNRHKGTERTVIESYLLLLQNELNCQSACHVDSTQRALDTGQSQGNAQRENIHMIDFRHPRCTFACKTQQHLAHN